MGVASLSSAGGLPLHCPKDASVGTSQENGCSIKFAKVHFGLLQECKYSDMLPEVVQKLQTVAELAPFQVEEAKNKLTLDHHDPPHTVLDRTAYGTLLQHFRKSRAFSRGKILHAEIMKTRHKEDLFLGNFLIQMYGRVGDLDQTSLIFDNLPRRNKFSWTFLIQAFVNCGYHEVAWQVYQKMQLEQVQPISLTFNIILGACISPAALQNGKLVHASVVKHGFELNVVLGTSLLIMYGRCGGLQDAQSMFDKLLQRDFVLWNAMIATYINCGHNREALNLFEMMCLEFVVPANITFVSVFSACGSLENLAEGKLMHAFFVINKLDLDMDTGIALVNMYSKCGSLVDARKLFESFSEQTVILWTAIIAAYSQHGMGIDALGLYEEMRDAGLEPDRVTFLGVLDACGSVGELAKSKNMHACVISHGYKLETSVQNALVSVYGKCGSICDARVIFNRMPIRDLISWTAIMTAYAQNELGREAMELFQQLLLQGFKPNKITLISALDACVDIKSLANGKWIHAQILFNNFQTDIVIGMSLVNIYCKCGTLDNAYLVLQTLPDRSILLWNAVITGNQTSKEPLLVFDRMREDGVEPDEISFVSTLEVCGNTRAGTRGKLLHSYIINDKLESGTAVETALIDMYGKCGDFKGATVIFDKMTEQTLFPWTAMIAAYVKHERGKVALKLFHSMQKQGIIPDVITLTYIVEACSLLGAIMLGKYTHACTIWIAFEEGLVLGTKLITMYGKFWDVDSAEMVFENMLEYNIVTWNALIAAYLLNGFARDALLLFRQMQLEDVIPDKISYVSAVDACASLLVLAEGKQMHADIIDNQFEHDVVVATALVNMYGRCGKVDDAWKTFSEMHLQNLVSWNTMMAAYAQNGYCKEALELLQGMQENGLMPNKVTFTVYLSACNHAGLVDDGTHLFTLICEGFGSDLVIEHCGCVIDLLGRVGLLDEAEELLRNIPFACNSVVWTALLGASRTHRDWKRGKCVAEKNIEIDPLMPGPYVLLSDIFAAAGEWDDVASVTAIM